jgi:hypothetical protein
VIHGDAPLSVTFSETLSGGEAPFTFNWSFGDGAWNDRATTVQHNYSAPAATGAYAVLFTVADSIADGQRANASIDIDVAPTLQVAPPQTTPGNPGVNSAVAAAVSVQGGLPPYSYSWSYGDGATSAEASGSNSTTHAYSSAGAYNLTVTVTDANGVTVSSHSTVTVGAPTGTAAQAGAFTLDDSSLFEFLLFPAVAVAFLGGAVFVHVEGSRLRRRRPPRGPGSHDPRFYSEPAYYLAPGWK